MVALAGFAPDQPRFYREGADAAFAHLRRVDPIHWYEAGGYWCVTRHEDVRSISCLPKQFCSGRGIVQGARNSGQAGFDGGGRSIIQMDPPEHNQSRKLLIGQFTPRAVAALERPIREIARASVAAVPSGCVVDFVESIAVPLPMIVIARLLGVSTDDLERFRVWSDVMIEAGGGNFGPTTGPTVVEIFQHLGTVMEERRRDPRDDLISMLVNGEVDGERLSEPDLLMFGLTLLVAGNETTRTLISGGTRALLDHPEQLDRLVRRPQLVPNAVEEMLRWVSPIRSFSRSATSDCELHGRKIAEGDFLELFYGSANRDAEVFGPDADVFDVARPNADRHLAFGAGEHLCLGAALARLEARVLFEELLPRLPGLRYAGEVEPLESVLVNGSTRMPVVFES